MVSIGMDDPRVEALAQDILMFLLGRFGDPMTLETAVLSFQALTVAAEAIKLALAHQGITLFTVPPTERN